MKRQLFVLLFFLFALSILSANAQTTLEGADGKKVDITDTSRIITIGSSVTETVFALGEGEHVIAVDESSNYPPAVEDLPKVPYIRSLSAEGILAMKPSLIISSEEAKPKTVISQLRTAGVSVLMIPDMPTLKGAGTKIELIGQALEHDSRADSIVTKIEEQLAKAEKLRSNISDRPEILFLLSAGSGQNTLMAGGTDTSAEAMMELAGGQNVFDSFSGYKPVSSEAVATANPEVILMMNSREHQVGGSEGLKSVPGISLTDAAKNNRLITMDGNYLLGFGPRLGDAVLELMNQLHPELKVNHD